MRLLFWAPGAFSRLLGFSQPFLGFWAASGLFLGFWTSAAGASSLVGFWLQPLLGLGASSLLDLFPAFSGPPQNPLLALFS